MTDLEKYALGLLAEEQAEATKNIGKWMRFGADHARHDGLTPRKGLSLEIGDVLAAIEYALNAGILDIHTVQEHAANKVDRLLNPLAVDDQGNRLAPELPTPYTPRIVLRMDPAE